MKTRQQGGFTLIELIMVIVILGILAVVAIPQFLDLRGEARLGAAQGVAGALGSAAAMNYAACSVGSTLCVSVAAGDACGAFTAMLQDPSSVTDAGYTIAGTAPTCSVTHADIPAASSPTFVGIVTN